MRILVDATSLVKNKTGIGFYLQRILDNIDINSKYEIILLSNSEIINNSQFKKIYIKSKIFGFLKGPLFLNSFFLYYSIKCKADFIWGPNGFIPILPLKAKKILTIHDFTHIYFPKSQKLINRIARIIFQHFSILNADLIICDSISTSNDLNKLYPNINSKIIKIIYPNYGDEIIKNNEDYKLDKSIDKNIITTVSTLEPRKNIDALLNGFIEFKSIYKKSKLKLIVIGGEGWKYKVRINHPDIVLTGYLDDNQKNNLLRQSKAFIYPSLYEGFGLPIVEAQVIGIPVIVGKHKSVLEAANSVCVSIDMNQFSIRNTFIDIENRRCPLVCRIPSDIHNNKFNKNNLLFTYIEEMIK